MSGLTSAATIKVTVLRKMNLVTGLRDEGHGSSFCRWHAKAHAELEDVSSADKAALWRAAQAEGLAQPKTLREYQESLRRAQRLVRRPSAAIPRSISNCANVNWNCYRPGKTRLPPKL